MVNDAYEKGNKYKVPFHSMNHEYSRILSSRNFDLPKTKD